MIVGGSWEASQKSSQEALPRDVPGGTLGGVQEPPRETYRRHPGRRTGGALGSVQEAPRETHRRRPGGVPGGTPGGVREAVLGSKILIFHLKSVGLEPRGAFYITF